VVDIITGQSWRIVHLSKVRLSKSRRGAYFLVGAIR
jgi:hypothetical protein